MALNGSLLESLDESLESSFDESLDESLDESFDESLDESLDEAEFLPLLGSLPIIGSAVSGVANAIGSALRPTPRPPLRGVRLPSTGGVSTATLNTPSGAAMLRLPSPVVSKSDFERVTGELRDAINRNSGRLNTLQADLTKMGNRVTAVVSDTQASVARSQAAQKRQLGKLRKDVRGALSRMRRRQADQQTMNLMISMMLMNQQQSRFDTHTHTVGAQTSSVPSDAGSDNSAMLMMLPMMMMGDSKGSGDNSMMMMMMMFAFMGQGGR